MGILDWALIVVILTAAGVMLHRPFRRKGTCSGCFGCSCGHAKSAVKIDGPDKK